MYSYKLDTTSIVTIFINIVKIKYTLKIIYFCTDGEISLGYTFIDLIAKEGITIKYSILVI